MNHLVLDNILLGVLVHISPKPLPPSPSVHNTNREVTGEVIDSGTDLPALISRGADRLRPRPYFAPIEIALPKPLGFVFTR